MKLQGGDPLLTDMTIQSFSERTGLPASTLRYYEKERLLQPSHRADNGYRYYREDQIPSALKIHTLRQAGIGLIEIRHYLAADADGQAGWLCKWRQDVDAKLLALNVAKQYLDGVDSVDEHIQLVRWSQSTRMLWFRHRVKRQLHPFAQAIDESSAYLEKRGLLHAKEAYVRQERIIGDEMLGKVGFRLPLKSAIPDDWKQETELEVELEVLQPTLFVTLDCLSTDPYACFSLMLVLQSFGFEPAGPNLERYQLHDKLHYQWMIPVVHGEETGPYTSDQ
ncbi:helix-turn-helix domain-containing protein [Paenibacillus sp. YIM B09110]|uniref:helix-turn-helix domain-containing protein n=1 Tax=Paenibacillus sp. YIM B09110 TaxID=3126102 RepID=UPI00301B8463